MGSIIKWLGYAEAFWLSIRMVTNCKASAIHDVKRLAQGFKMEHDLILEDGPNGETQVYDRVTQSVVYTGSYQACLVLIGKYTVNGGNLEDAIKTAGIYI